MRKCHDCDSVVAAEDNICKNCGSPQNTIEMEVEKNPPYRSRFLLLFYAWIGGVLGAHLKFLGYHEEASEICSNNNPVLLLAIFTQPIVAIGVFSRMVIIQSTLPFMVMFGWYRNDANGYPVRYFKPKQK